MSKSELLLVDGVGNLLLGVLLLAVPGQLAGWLGIPTSVDTFYASLFGAVLFGIGLALLMERRGGSVRGLGLAGALVINTCFALALLAWLILGSLDLPFRGTAVLWGLAILLLGLSGVELASELGKGGRETA